MIVYFNKPKSQADIEIQELLERYFYDAVNVRDKKHYEGLIALPAIQINGEFVAQGFVECQNYLRN